eukprot:6479817-Amphidinium_carterae.1
MKDVKKVNKTVKIVKTKPQRLSYWHLQSQLRLLSCLDASYRNTADYLSQRGHVIRLAQSTKTSLTTSRARYNAQCFQRPFGTVSTSFS